MPSQVSFVISTGNPSTNTKTRNKLIRAHATASYYREKRRKDVEEHKKRKGRDTAAALIQKVHLISQVNDYQSFKLEPPIEIDVDFDLSPWSYVGQGGTDPFITQPSSITRRMQKHLYYYVNVHKPRMNPSWPYNVVRRRFGCSGMLYSDPILLHSASATSATARAVSIGHYTLPDLTAEIAGAVFHADATDCLYYKGKTIELINLKLSKFQGNVDDNITAAICDMILLEAYTGNIRDAQTHLNGLKSILRLRPALDQIPYATASRITSSDIKISTLSLSKPTIPLTIFSDVSSLPIYGVDMLLPRLASKLVGPNSYTNFNSSTNAAIQDLARMTRYTEAVFNGMFPWTQDDSYSDYFEYQLLTIEHRLLSHSPKDQENTTIIAGDPMLEAEACRLACILFLNTALCNAYPNSSAIILNTVRALRNAIENLTPGGLSHSAAPTPYNEVLCWILFIGSHCSHARGDRQFFVGAFRATFEVLGLASWKDSRTVLEGFLFFDRSHLEHLKEVWN